MADEQTNKSFAKTDKVFIEACNRAGVQPTTRQASKYRNRRGLAYKCRPNPKEVK